ncbi:MAG: hypothetical protein ACYC4L_06030 [Chloroflexota bacterium]
MWRKNCYRLVSVFDVDPRKVGSKVGEVPVYHSDRITELVPQAAAEIAILVTPAPAAQPSAERLVEAGIQAILNCAPVALTLLPTVTVRQVDLSREMQLLTFRASEHLPRVTTSGPCCQRRLEG